MLAMNLLRGLRDLDRLANHREIALLTGRGLGSFFPVYVAGRFVSESTNWYRVSVTGATINRELAFVTPPLLVFFVENNRRIA